MRRIFKSATLIKSEAAIACHIQIFGSFIFTDVTQRHVAFIFRVGGGEKLETAYKTARSYDLKTNNNFENITSHDMAVN
jgi:hypothetical protein